MCYSSIETNIYFIEYILVNIYYLMAILFTQIEEKIKIRDSFINIITMGVTFNYIYLHYYLYFLNYYTLNAAKMVIRGIVYCLCVSLFDRQTAFFFFNQLVKLQVPDVILG